MIGLVVQLECDAVAADGCDCPISLIVTYETAVQGGCSIVFILGDMVSIAVKIECAILYSEKLLAGFSPYY